MIEKHRMQVISVNLATVAPLFTEQSSPRQRIVTGIHKKPVSGSVQIGKLGLIGDEQADLTVHGGLNKAVYAYPSEHYAFWIERRRAARKSTLALPFGSMGENLTLAGLLEQDVWVGDRLLIGGTVLEVTEPRRPCFKFNVKMDDSHAVKAMVQSGFTGFYLRVIQIGMLQSGDAVTLMPGTRQLSISAINQRRRNGGQRDLFDR